MHMKLTSNSILKDSLRMETQFTNILSLDKPKQEAVIVKSNVLCFLMVLT